MKIDLLPLKDLKLGFLRTLLSLPAPLLRFMSGGSAVYIDGRTLNPQIQYLSQNLGQNLGRAFFETASRSNLAVASRTIEQARQEWQDLVHLLSPMPDLKVTVETISGETTASGFGGVAPVSGLWLKPAYIKPEAPCLVLFHQGGGVIGGPNLSLAFAQVLAARSACPIFIPDLRLAPLHRFPAALEDAHAAYAWAALNAQRLGSRSGHLMIGGILTGAGLALRIALDLRHDFRPLPKVLMLITPLTDMSDDNIRDPLFNDVWPIGSRDIDTMIAHYLGASTPLNAPLASPALEASFTGLPSCLIINAGFDPLAKQGLALVQKLKAAGVKTIYRRYDRLPLGFDLFVGVVEDAKAATVDIAMQLRQLWAE